ncbi:hypothetical protein CJ030_MR3G017055 [Morella rubra]|uniref:Uncharacterized protein n=1 Tax=Morella rubra TaxID=262757 RepID=A0A6A1W4V0_9ROSI|nr:hypothetical protein CJ030_MR3G017055 [Morella rubra]
MGKFMKEKLNTYNVEYLRYVYCNDMVPRIPYDDDLLFFKHFSRCLYYNSLYDDKDLENEPNKNYFSLFWVIPKYLNAFWEFTRSFIIPYTTGPEFRGSFSMKLFRVAGLAIPGLSAHSTQDYVNITRLSSPPICHCHPPKPNAAKTF